MKKILLNKINSIITYKEELVTKINYKADINIIEDYDIDYLFLDEITMSIRERVICSVLNKRIEMYSLDIKEEEE